MTDKKKEKPSKCPVVEMTEEEIINFKPYPPRWRPWDYVPLFVTDRLRRAFGFPAATPFERWIIGLCVLKSMVERAAIAVEQERRGLAVAPYTHAEPAPDKGDPWRWS